MEEIESVLIEDTAPPGHAAAVEIAFRRAGFSVEVHPELGRKASDLLPWIVQITLATPVAAYFAAFGSEAGKDSYAAVKSWVKDVWAAREGAGTGEGSVLIRDVDQTNLVLHSQLPDDALEALREVDWEAVRGDYLIWDEARASWLDYRQANRP